MMHKFEDIVEFLTARRLPGRPDVVRAYLEYAQREGFVAIVRRTGPDGKGAVCAVMTTFAVRGIGAGFSWPESTDTLDEEGDGIWIDELAADDWSVVPGIWRQAVAALGRRAWVGWKRDRVAAVEVWAPVDAVDRRMRGKKGNLGFWNADFGLKGAGIENGGAEQIQNPRSKI